VTRPSYKEKGEHVPVVRECNINQPDLFSQEGLICMSSKRGGSRGVKPDRTKDGCKGTNKKRKNRKVLPARFPNDYRGRTVTTGEKGVCQYQGKDSSEQNVTCGLHASCKRFGSNAEWPSGENSAWSVLEGDHHCEEKL